MRKYAWVLEELVSVSLTREKKTKKLHAKWETRKSWTATLAYVLVMKTKPSGCAL